MYTPKRQSVSRDKTRTPHGYSSPYTEERLTKRFCPKRYHLINIEAVLVLYKID